MCRLYCMNRLLLIILVVVSCSLCACGRDKNVESQNNKDMNIETIYFAGGCFWGTEHFMKQINGVTTTAVGYANGTTPAPSYKDVCTGNTGYAETVKVDYNTSIVSLQQLIDLYLLTIDPTSLNRQGGDRGTQYRTGIYYTTQEQRKIVENSIRSLQINYKDPIRIEIEPLHNFYGAEGYHQDYLDKNPNGYCHINPTLFDVARKANAKIKYAKPDDSTLRNVLTPEEYAVTQENATEAPFTGKYWDEKRKGIYVDITTGEPLFISSDKFDSGCGWPSFSRPIDPSVINENRDTSHGMIRTEVRSKSGNAHLGHLFNDGPKELGGMRYCINSASLRFIPIENMEAEGYGKYISIIK